MGMQAGVNATADAPTGAEAPPVPKSIIGQYGSWAANLVEDPPQLSFRRKLALNIDDWRATARAKISELLSSPAEVDATGVQTLSHEQFDGLDIEHISWQLPYGRATQAVLLKPHGATGPLPAVLGLHDHGGNKYFGHRKITRTSQAQHPLIIEHQAEYYAGLAWANELARQGYVVLVPDTFAFGSRRVLYQDMAEIPWGACRTQGRSDDDPESMEHIEAYNKWASEHESIMAKSLFCGGTTWPGVFLAEDQAALSVLCARPEVDSTRVGCAGLSGGGLRTVFLGGIDQRIQCAICVGFLSTWRDFLMFKAYTHTWMAYVPLLSKFLDFPEILGLRAPLPTMTQNCTEDPLYTLPEMQRANSMLEEIYAKADAQENYSGQFYAGGHRFDQSMQKAAFAWFHRWLQ
jgi:dienelactone hydrolase